MNQGETPEEALVRELQELILDSSFLTPITFTSYNSDDFH
ncbi:MAG: ADP-ribose pyrophosphatase (precursor) [Candidatus Tokpelaia sp. JSC161]|jgi:ADP-ribose pyrophosphatase YjhB (NUDIX family)|nr:MAG: ADP-ribose pyrophosphatase (precursor) [Candidatus Tokpelaia sp. JSC161]